MTKLTELKIEGQKLLNEKLRYEIANEKVNLYNALEKNPNLEHCCNKLLPPLPPKPKPAEVESCVFI